MSRWFQCTHLSLLNDREREEISQTKMTQLTFRMIGRKNTQKAIGQKRRKGERKRKQGRNARCSEVVGWFRLHRQNKFLLLLRERERERESEKRAEKKYCLKDRKCTELTQPNTYPSNSLKKNAFSNQQTNLVQGVKGS